MVHYRLRDFLANLHDFEWQYCLAQQTGSYYGIRTKETDNCRCPIEAIGKASRGRHAPELDAICQSIGIPFYTAIVAAADNALSDEHAYANVQELRAWLLYHCGFSKIKPGHDSAKVKL